MRIRTIGFFGALAIGGTLIACGSSRDGFTQDNGGTEPGGSSGGLDNGTFGKDGGANEAAPAPFVCAPSPENYDFPGNDCDDDADGTVDNPPSCDTGLAQVGSAEEFAKAIGLCAKATDNGGWGLVSAKYTRGYGRDDEPQPDQHGVLPKFGDVLKPREGKSLGVLSNGYAQEYNGSEGTAFGPGPDKLDHSKDWYDYKSGVEFGKPPPPGNGTLPPEFPKASPSCGSAALGSIANDVINVKLEIKAPKNANGLKFDFNFFSSEWPQYICSAFNDGFLAFLTAKSFNGGKGDNVSFDASNNPISVNNGFFDRCTPNVPTGCALGATRGESTCPGGPEELAGTGYGLVGKYCRAGLFTPSPSTSGGATGWLTSKAPIQAGETFTLEFMIWDTGDGSLDSSVLIDNFGWAEGRVVTKTERPK